MATRTEAYVDTGALIAFADASDSHHALFRRLFAKPPPLVTTPLVVAEGHGWFLRRFDGARALQFLSMVEEIRPLRVMPVGPVEQHAAAALLRRYSDQPLTLADAVGLCVMKARRIRSCWSTDRHLGLTGVPLVIHRQ
ncbi:MAG: type II toxin-antitoxin system VapC family toxin [Gammaproteobacteria bacterium]|nr:type II toxin-antitoxin system VapC family toxin [Gammaproteobacteria bacterium]